MREAKSQPAQRFLRIVPFSQIDTPSGIFPVAFPHRPLTSTCPPQSFTPALRSSFIGAVHQLIRCERNAAIQPQRFKHTTKGDVIESEVPCPLVRDIAIKALHCRKIHCFEASNTFVYVKFTGAPPLLPKIPLSFTYPFSGIDNLPKRRPCPRLQSFSSSLFSSARHA